MSKNMREECLKLLDTMEECIKSYVEKNTKMYKIGLIDKTQLDEVVKNEKIHHEKISILKKENFFSKDDYEAILYYTNLDFLFFRDEDKTASGVTQ